MLLCSGQRRLLEMGYSQSEVPRRGGPPRQSVGQWALFKNVVKGMSITEAALKARYSQRNHPAPNGLIQ